MNNIEGVKTGVFLCGCGKVIDDRLDMAALEERMKGTEGVVAVRRGSQYCLSPGLSKLAETVKSEGLNRVLIGACSDRIIKKRFAGALKDLGILDSQIEIVNLKDHIVLVHDEPAADLTRKGAALMGGAAASLRALNPVAPESTSFEGPAIILGGGISGFTAARELALKGMKSIVISDCHNVEQVLASLPARYPGARIQFEYLQPLLEDVFTDPMVSFIPDAPLEYLDGHIGNYRLGFKSTQEQINEVQGSLIILALDREFLSGKETSPAISPHVMDQAEFENYLSRTDSVSGNVVFWVDGPDGQKERELALLSAWDNSRFLARNYPEVSPVILYPDDLRLPLTGRDLLAGQEQKIRFQPYDPGFNPSVRTEYLDFVTPRNRVKHEIRWDILVSSATPAPPTAKAIELSRLFPVFPTRKTVNEPALKLKPTQEPVERVLLVGSARQPCTLDEALLDGKTAARKALSARKKADAKKAAGHYVVTVDQSLCAGCGLCDEVCTCGAIEKVRPGKGPLPRTVDCLACDGGGSCAAACPYNAMTVVNGSSLQLEARIKAVLSRMREDDVLGLACNWGGQGAAEMAAVKGLKYPNRFFMLTVRCLGTIDPASLSMAFLNGANHIMLAGCSPSVSCHYGYGVDHTWFRTLFIEKLLSLAGLERQRISLGYMNVNEPDVFVRMAQASVAAADRLGPITRTESQRERLQAVHATLNRPRVRWILGVGLRRPSEIETPIMQVPGLSLDEVFTDVLEEEYLAARIVGVLSSGPLNPRQIAKNLDEPVEKISPLLLEMTTEKRIVLTAQKDRYPLFAPAGILKSL